MRPTQCPIAPDHRRLAQAPLFAAIAALVMVLNVPAVLAHHGWSGYHTDLRKLEGTAAAYAYEYPHAALRLEADGKTLDIVLAPPSRMGRRGLEAISIKPGDRVAVEGYVHRDRDTEVRAERIVVNGQTYELR
jgi:hypothetical protein